MWSYSLLKIPTNANPEQAGSCSDVMSVLPLTQVTKPIISSPITQLPKVKEPMTVLYSLLLGLFLTFWSKFKGHFVFRWPHMVSRILETFLQFC